MEWNEWNFKSYEEFNNMPTAVTFRYHSRTRKKWWNFVMYTIEWSVKIDRNCYQEEKFIAPSVS